MKFNHLMMACAAATAVGMAFAGSDAEKIKADGMTFKEDKFQDYDRIVFDFEGCEAWVVQPTKPAADGRWVWCMEWPTAFADRTGVRDLLAAGYRWVAFNPAYIGILDKAHSKMTAGNQNDEMIQRRARFQAYLVKKLGLTPKCGLIGMSWGGYYSVRYASTLPKNVCAMYLDAPLLDFSTLAGYSRKDAKTGKMVGQFESLSKYYPFATADYVGKDDPFQSVNRAAPIAKAKIPVLVVYGGSDTTVNAEKNCMRFAESFEKAGGHIKMWRDNKRGHHPHGLDLGEQQVFVNFFNAAFDPPKKPAKKAAKK